MLHRARKSETPVRENQSCIDVVALIPEGKLLLKVAADGREITLASGALSPLGSCRRWSKAADDTGD